MTKRNVKKILATYELSTNIERIEGAQWYKTACKLAYSLSSEFDIQLVTAAGVISALSPHNRWLTNIRNSTELIAAYKIDKESASVVKVSTFNRNKDKALTILNKDHELKGLCPDKIILESTFENFIKDTLSGPKLIEFFNSILLDTSEVTVDGHAFNIWNGQKVALSKVKAISKKLRIQIKQDYIAAANELSITPSACQATTWCAWRRIHGITK